VPATLSPDITTSLKIPQHQKLMLYTKVLKT
jgi:hypothetical protein